jgi:hypothetical protein
MGADSLVPVFLFGKISYTVHNTPSKEPKVATRATDRFDPVDLDQMRLLAKLTAGQRIRALLDARELAAGLIRGRLRRQHPNLSPRAINLKLVEEVSRGE